MQINRGAFMTKLSIKPIWIATFGLLISVAMVLKVAMAFSTTFIPADEPIGYVAQDDLTNYDLRSNQERVFRPQYEKDTWSGDLLAYGISSTGALGVTPKFVASDMLDARTAARIIVTMKDDGTKIPFQFSSLSSVQQGYLTSSDILNFLRGDRSKEVSATPPGTLRARGSALGDIIHSRPLFISDTTLATGALKTATSPLPTVFVGSNDGMLHAFDASTGVTGGAERWAYVPSMLLSKMKALSANPYKHDYYVDGSVNMGYILSGTKRILVGALGAGGKGLYALDISGDAGLAPADEATAANKILWEIADTKVNNVTNDSYVNLGYTYSNPIMGNFGGIDVVIVGNGYLGKDGKAYLYVINANTGVLIKTFSTDNQTGNGLSTPVSVDVNKNGTTGYVYAGDLLGRLWKFDLTGSASSGTILYDTAKSPRQPITTTPGVAVHPNGGYMVTFATGSMLLPSDSTDSTTVYGAYGVWDAAPAFNTDMLQQTLATSCFSYSGANCIQYVRTITGSKTPDWTAGSSSSAHTLGWYTALPAGERVVGDTNFIENGRYYFNSYNPTLSTVVTAGAQAVMGGNYLLELDYLSGGVSINQPFLDLNGDVKLTDADRQVWRTGDPAPASITPAGGTAPSNGNPIMTRDGIPVGKFVSIGLMSQPLLVQLASLNNTLFNQNPDVTVPPVLVDRGVSGGHFDVDTYYDGGSGWLTCTDGCDHQDHVHEYDDIYDVTGVNFLDSSSLNPDLSNAISSTSTKFKVLVQNQYLSPATKLYIGKAGYVFNVDAGYVDIKSYQTDPTITAALLASSTSTIAPVYTRSTIKSFAVNMPVNAFDIKDWWGGVNGLAADSRVGLHPDNPSCLYNSAGTGDGNMYQPVIPPVSVKSSATISSTDTGNGTLGYNPNDKNNTKATGVRHNGALTFQIIKDNTPASALELVVKDQPEYGWTVKKANFKDYVLAEYNIYWHYGKGYDEHCYGTSGWKKNPAKDQRVCGTKDNVKTTICAKPQSASDGTDPMIGSLGTASGGVAGAPVVTAITNGTRTTITYSDGYVLTIDKTTDPQTGITTTHTWDNRTGGINTTTTTVNPDGANKSGGDERGLQSRTGRVSWRELVQP
jgi:hypothetical protein